MRIFYPQLSLSGLPIGTGRVAVWKGAVQPIQTLSHLEYLLDDLACDRSVQVLPGGGVEHLNQCRAVHVEHQWMEEITNPFVRFTLRVEYGGGAIHPRAYVIEPDYPNLKWRHRFSDGAICPYAPWEKVWLWDKHTVVDFMDSVVIWLIKSIVWFQAHVWTGAERSHDADYLLGRIEHKAPCWCGSGKHYAHCHRFRDQVAVFNNETAILNEFNNRNPFSIRPLPNKSIRRSRRALKNHRGRDHGSPSRTLRDLRATAS